MNDPSLAQLAIRVRLRDVAGQQRDLVHPQDVQARLIGVADKTRDAMPGGRKTQCRVVSGVAGGSGYEYSHAARLPVGPELAPLN